MRAPMQMPKRTTKTSCLVDWTLTRSSANCRRSRRGRLSVVENLVPSQSSWWTARSGSSSPGDAFCTRLTTTLLAALVLRHAAAYDLGGAPRSARVCVSLQEARDERFFFEAMFDFTQERIPFGRRYNGWRKRMATEMEQGKHLWYLGR